MSGEGCEIFLKATEASRPECHHLFLSIGFKKKGVAKNTISLWIRRVIMLAYESAPRIDRLNAHPRARELRAFGPTIAFKKNLSVSQVLRAGVWKKQTTFASFYLRDVTHKSLDTYSLGPVVAAQQVV